MKRKMKKKDEKRENVDAPSRRGICRREVIASEAEKH